MSFDLIRDTQGEQQKLNDAKVMHKE